MRDFPWKLAAVFIALDVLSTWVALTWFGAKELNPLWAWAINPHPWTVFVFGGVLLVAVTMLARPVLESDVAVRLSTGQRVIWGTLLLIGVVRMLVVANNVSVISTLR